MNMNPSIPPTLNSDSVPDPAPAPGLTDPPPAAMSSPPSSERLPVPPVAGAKRPAPSLLPAFEPHSSPSLPPHPKRRRVSPSPLDREHELYPTPIPTSSTGMVPSSPPLPPSTRRQQNSRATSTFSERAPLSTVPSIELDRDGEPILMGRSSNASDYQLSTNSLVSRVHIVAVYLAAETEPRLPARILVECKGWNGAKVHCQGRAWDLRRGDTFTCVTEGVDIMVDVQDARVLVSWPRQEVQISTPADTESLWDDDGSPGTAVNAGHRESPYQSPSRTGNRLQSPVSPSPAVQAVFPSTADLLASNLSLPPPVHVYEDEDCSEETELGNVNALEATQSTQQASQSLSMGMLSSQSSELSDPFDADEENDPVIHSFGPFGANLLPRMEAVTTRDRNRRSRSPLKPINETIVIDSTDSTTEVGCPVVNHVVNQLAYSRLASTPLSNLMDHLPPHLKSNSPGSKENCDLTLEALKKMLDATECVGEVEREGKDAAGKVLESEYYYIAELDSDETRKNAVVEDLKKPGLRACRKQHKQYFWRKPKN